MRTLHRGSMLPSDTQLESWISIQPELGRRQRGVLTLIKNGSGLASFEIANKLNIPFHCAAPRVTELCAKGLIRDSGRRTWNPFTKRNVIVWEGVPNEI